MAQIGYNETVMDHFMNPRNVGVIENPDGYGKVGNPVCGDLMEIFINVKDDRIDDIKFRTFGCGSAIAVSSMVTVLKPGGRCPARCYQRLLGEDRQDQPPGGCGGRRGPRGRSLRYR